MKEFIKQLNELRDAKNAADFVAKEKLAFTAYDFIEGRLKKQKKEAIHQIKGEQVAASINAKKLKIEAIKKLSKEELKDQARRRVADQLKGEFAEFKKTAHELLDVEEGSTLEWIEHLPELLMSDERKKRKKAKKDAINLIRITSLRNIMTWETVAALKRQIVLTKNYSELMTLHKGEVIAGYRIPTLKERFEKAKERAAASVTGLDVVDIEYGEFKEYEINKFNYLNKKKFADQLSTILNVVVCVLGIGMLSALAFVAILPVLSVVVAPFAAIGILIGASLIFSYTEGPVFYGYIRKFCRQLFVGFFEGIDNAILNRRAFEEFKKRDRHALSPDEIAHIKKRYATERYVKYGLVGLSFIISGAAGFGFLGLLFTEIAEVFAVLGFVSVATVTVMPWVLAALAAPVYAIVTAGMLYQAIKNNYFQAAIEHIKDLFSYERAQEKAKKKGEEPISYAKHVLLCLLKALGLAVVLGFSFVAVFATAGLWIETNINFLIAAIGMMEKVANVLGTIVGGFHLFETMWFCIEKTLSTVNTIFNNNNFVEVVKDTFSSPKKFFMALPTMLFFACHLIGNGAVAALGSLSDLFKGIQVDASEMVKPLAVGSAEIASEFLIDFGDNIGHAHHSAYEEKNLGHFYTEKEKHNHDHDGHSHGNIVKSVASGASMIGNGAKLAAEKLGLFTPPAKVKPKPLPAFSRAAPRAVA